MSIGPKVKEDGLFKPNVASRLHSMAAKNIGLFFQDPLTYILYGTLVGIIATLFAGNKVPVELYAIECLLVSAKVFLFYKPFALTKIEPISHGK